MLIDPRSLRDDLDRLEEIERATLRLVVQGIYDFRSDAEQIFREETDRTADIGEDITREALNGLGVSRIGQRLFGTTDYKRARYLFHPSYAVKQALFIDSKAEKGAPGVIRLQTSQTSLTVYQHRAGEDFAEKGGLPPILAVGKERFITATVFVKYHYWQSARKQGLESISIAALPNGLLQERYNPDCGDTIWNAGPNAPSRNEVFRVRINLAKLQSKARWRVQVIQASPKEFVWDE